LSGGFLHQVLFFPEVSQLMSTATSTRPVSPVPSETSPGAVSDVVVGGLLLAALTTGTCWLLGLPTSHLLVALGLYAIQAGLVLRNLPRPVAGPGIGLANRVTLGRSLLVIAVVALTVWPGGLTDRGYWWVLALSIAGMTLDGVDGQIARRTKSSTAFGARFDMEVDALLLLTLSVMVALSDKVGGWVILIGGIRYLFVAAGLRWPALEAPLPHSMRRKTVCVVQGVTLIVCIAPIIPATLATTAAAISLLLLVYSFGVDIRWLLVNHGSRRLPVTDLTAPASTAR
jgi:phosphatidylglycerophosphate synthase